MQQLPATSPLDSYSQGQVLGRGVQEGGCTECPSPSDAISTPTSLAPAPGQVYSDEFAQFRLKVEQCPLRTPHPWTSCPYSHVGERAARRDPLKFSYTGIACLGMKYEGSCALGTLCPCAHNDFEYWLHPTRYHTALCNKGASCNRPFCFFAHHPSEVRTPALRPGEVCPEARACVLAAAAGGAPQLPQSLPGTPRAPAASPWHGAGLLAGGRHGLSLGLGSGAGTGCGCGGGEKLSMALAAAAALPGVHTAAGGPAPMGSQSVLLALSQRSSSEWSGPPGSLPTSPRDLILGCLPFPASVAAAAPLSMCPFPMPAPGPAPPSPTLAGLVATPRAAPVPPPPAAAAEDDGFSAALSLLQAVADRLGRGQIDGPQAASLLGSALSLDTLQRLELHLAEQRPQQPLSSPRHVVVGPLERGLGPGV